jgi:three-Cys-motif partner protein
VRHSEAFILRGSNISRRTGGFIPGSPLNALSIKKPFLEYHFIDLNNQKIAELERIAGEREDVFIHHGDCNEILPEKILPRANYTLFGRALCILDPYGLHLNWELIEAAGRMKSVEIFLNFPVMDINMNVLKHDPNNVDPKQIERMNSFWGDESWREVAYKRSVLKWHCSVIAC